MTSNPTNADSDEDGIEDDDDEYPLLADVLDVIIYQTRNRPEKTYDRDIEKLIDSKDMAYGDEDYLQLLSNGLLFAVADVTPEFMIWREMELLFAMGTISASKDMKAIVSNMIGRFRSGTGEDYTNDALNDIVKNHKNVERFVSDTKDIVVKWLGENDASLSSMIYDEDRNEGTFGSRFNDSITNANLDLSEDTYNGLAITIHGFHGYDISITDYKRYDDSFEGVLHFKYFDHFGLDNEDYEWAPGFCDWYTLQHYTRFNGAYKPFVSYIEFDIPFSGQY